MKETIKLENKYQGETRFCVCDERIAYGDADAWTEDEVDVVIINNDLGLWSRTGYHDGDWGIWTIDEGERVHNPAVWYFRADGWPWEQETHLSKEDVEDKGTEEKTAHALALDYFGDFNFNEPTTQTIRVTAPSAGTEYEFSIELKETEERQ